jgi:hypothetical protein
MMRKLIGDFLSTKADNVYHLDSITKKPFPYVVFDFPQSIDDGESSKAVILDVDIWDMPSDNSTTTVEGIAEAIKGDGVLTNPTGLDQALLADATTTLWATLDTEFYMPEDDKRIKRKRITFTIKAYEGS